MIKLHCTDYWLKHKFELTNNTSSESGKREAGKKEGKRKWRNNLQQVNTGESDHFLHTNLYSVSSEAFPNRTSAAKLRNRRRMNSKRRYSILYTDTYVNDTKTALPGANLRLCILPSCCKRQKGCSSWTNVRLFFWHKSSASVLQTTATWGLNVFWINSTADCLHCAIATEQ